MNKVGKSVCTNPHRSAAHSVYRSIHYIISNVKYHFGYCCRNRSIARRLTNTTSTTKMSTSSSQKVADERKTAAKKVLLDFFITWYSRWENVEWLSVKILFLFLFRKQGVSCQQKISRKALGTAAAAAVFFIFISFYSHSAKYTSFGTHSWENMRKSFINSARTKKCGSTWTTVDEGKGNNKIVKIIGSAKIVPVLK